MTGNGAQPPVTDDDFRADAARRYVEHRGGVRVPLWATVSRAPGGAFVEMIAWVPDDPAHPSEYPDARHGFGARS